MAGSKVMTAKSIICTFTTKKFRSSMNTFLVQLLELVWDVIMSIPIHAIRLFYLKLLLKGARKSKNLRLHRHIRAIQYGRISIGDNTYINRNVLLDGRSGLEIGSNVDIGEYVKIWSLEHNPNDENHSSRGEKTIIEDHVWIAPWSMIMPGVRIGRGAVVGGGSVVTKDVPPLAIVAGAPARIIGTRENSLSYTINAPVYL